MSDKTLVERLQATAERKAFEFNEMARYRCVSRRFTPDQYDEWMAAARIEELEAENERLSHNVKTLTANGKAIEAENERLRAALEKIKSHHMEAWGDEFQRGINFCAEKAREALGGSDE